VVYGHKGNPRGILAETVALKVVERGVYSLLTVFTSRSFRLAASRTKTGGRLPDESI